MKLEDVRQRGIDLRLKAYRDMMSRDLPASIICSLLLIGLFVMTLQSPEEWAKGEWLKPDGWLYRRYGLRREPNDVLLGRWRTLIDPRLAALGLMVPPV